MLYDRCDDIFATDHVVIWLEHPVGTVGTNDNRKTLSKGMTSRGYAC